MEAGLAAFVEGKIVRARSGCATGELAVRKLAALEALSRATGAAGAAGIHHIQPNLWPTSAVIDWYLVLKRTPALPQRDQRWRRPARSCARA
jgi:hypothetical protein